jgi:CRP/FNR family transcriptional regulator
VTSGVLKLSKIHPDNRRYTVALLFSGDLLSGAFRPRQTCTVEAATKLELCVIPLEALFKLFKEAPELERALFRASVRELEACQDWALLLRGCSAYLRVAGLLLRLATRAQLSANPAPGNGAPVCFPLPLSRGEIAGLLGITIETLSRQMTLMKKARVIEISGSRDVTVPDVALLAAQAASDASGGDISGNLSPASHRFEG